MLTSPDGTQSELNDYFVDPSFVPHGDQVLTQPFNIDPAGDINGDSTFTWTFNTNRNWGESTNPAVIVDPVTGEPQVGPGDQPIFRNWELHIENWGSAAMGLDSVEIVWHGNPVAQPSQYVSFDTVLPGSPGFYQPLQAGQNDWDQRWLNSASGAWRVPMAQRIQGNVGIDTNGDNQFNFDRYVQEINAGSFNFSGYDASAPRTTTSFANPTTRMSTKMEFTIRAPTFRTRRISLPMLSFHSIA